jgi:glycerol uptake facilitator protein
MVRRLQRTSKPKGVTVEDRDTRAFIAEFLGTFLLVTFICFIVTIHSKAGLGVADFAVIGLVHFFALTVLIVTLGDISGAHFNPAVTVTMASLKKIKPADAAVYIVLQLVAAVLAAYVVKLVLNDIGASSSYGGVSYDNGLLEGKTSSALLIEIIGTFILVWTIMGTAVHPTKAISWAPLAIGAALGLAVLMFAPLTGAGFNPARAFGPDLVGHTIDNVGIGNFLIVYVLGPIVGGALAGFGYSYMKGEGIAPVKTLP